MRRGGHRGRRLGGERGRARTARADGSGRAGEGWWRDGVARRREAGKAREAVGTEERQTGGSAWALRRREGGEGAEADGGWGRRARSDGARQSGGMGEGGGGAGWACVGCRVPGLSRRRRRPPGRVNKV